jgi:crotonobetainyl-CoA:carnitine CoA-transferase CaiB-like acyl-CoA transferase
LVWNSNGKNYIEPVAFFKALIAKEAIIATAPVVTPADAPVAPVPTHDEAGAKAHAVAEKTVVTATPATPAAPENVEARANVKQRPKTNK